MNTQMSVHECAGKLPIALLLNDGRRIPVTDEALRHEQTGVKRVVWDDGSESWAKSWWWDDSSECCRIGAGAYGDYVIVRFT